MITIDTGKMLTDYCDLKRIFKSGLARKSGISYQLIIRAFKTKMIGIVPLIKISYALEHNFLMDIACQLPKNFSTNAPVDVSASNEIEILKEKIKQLETEKQILLQVVGKNN